MNAKSLWKFLKDSVVQWIEDAPFPLAAALSYYTLFLARSIADHCDRRLQALPSVRRRRKTGSLRPCKA